MNDLYEVRYMIDRVGELIASGLSIDDAQKVVREMAVGMHEEQIADIVIRQQFPVGSID